MDGAVVRGTLERIRMAGIPLAGTASPDLPAADRERLAAFLARGLGDGLPYLGRTASWRAALQEWLPWARGLFVAALPYNTRRDFSAHWIRRGRTWVSRYAWGRDYHRLLVARLRPAARFLEARGFKARICVDSAPILERAYAVKAGLGFIGKNGCLVHAEWGSYLFLAEIVTDLPLEDSGPPPGVCWGCERCLRSCPAQAFAEPHVLDPRRCLSTWTIEHRGPFPGETPRLKGHLFGCDRCQEVCPFNLEAPLASDPELEPRPGWFAPAPEAVLALSPAEWERRSTGSPLRRAGLSGLHRNAGRILWERRTAKGP
jgi:epoxyqueuosine reductase